MLQLNEHYKYRFACTTIHRLVSHQKLNQLMTDMFLQLKEAIFETENIRCIPKVFIILASGKPTNKHNLIIIHTYIYIIRVEQSLLYLLNVHADMMR